MRIYTHIEFDIKSRKVLREESFDYSGPIAQLKGKGSPPVEEAPEPDPTPTYEEEAEPTSKKIRDEEARKLRLRKGMAGTILTSPLGSAGQGASGKNILGG